MSIRYYMDEHVDTAITRGLRRRGIDVLTIQDDGFLQADDADILDRATLLGRVVFSRDKDFLAHAAYRQTNGIPFAGVAYAHQQGATIGQCVNDLELMAFAYDPADMENHVEHLPLRGFMTDDLRSRVLAIYAAVDADVAAAGPRCDTSGRCCRFKEYGHTLFISNLEAEVLLDSAPPYAKQVSGDFCPFQVDNLCTAREPRPLGCRVYFCDPTYQETGTAISDKYLRQLKELADEHGTGWRYAPLHYFLNEAEGRGPAVVPDTTKRIALPITG